MGMGAGKAGPGQSGGAEVLGQTFDTLSPALPPLISALRFPFLGKVTDICPLRTVVAFLHPGVDSKTSHIGEREGKY